MSIDCKALGQWGEDLASRFLEKRRYVILARNFSCPFGEVDLVCQHRGVLVFVEVKTRRGRGGNFIRPEDSVGRNKKRHLIKCVLFYLREKDCLDEPCRVDIISVHKREKQQARIRHLRDCIWEVH